MLLSSSDSAGGQVNQRARDAELLARIRRGDEAAFEALFRAHAVPLRAFAFEYVKSRDIAVEVVHDVFLRIWQRRDRLEIRESFQAYIFRATRNRALDVVKRTALEQRYIETAVRESVAGETGAPSSAQRTLEQHDLAAAMELVVAEFPERRRMVFTLRWKSGMTHEEIADLMGISTKTVENQITHALRELRTRLTPYL